MSRSSRAAVAARVIGTLAASAALAVGTADTALACTIGDFSAAAVCDAGGNGVIRVTDKDASGTPATVSLYLQLDQPINNQRLVDTKTIAHPTAQGVTVDLNPLEWHAGTTFRVHVKAGDLVDDDIQPLVVVEDENCASASPSASASASGSASASASAVGTPSGQASATSAQPSSSSDSDSDSAYASASASPSSVPSALGGSGNLAETGASSGTAVIAGVAGALVVVGGGIVLGLRRRADRRIAR
ncbi:LAETG motif-containing sortase-dependent surface protein [Streptomyces sp. NPDC006872]|uniref:LAETG motif-containing sortase-dependent surface protein n=1 Tax=Streptomyces sp. NPDC006872 TaxID=3155720 RepID=UPI003400BA37